MNAKLAYKIQKLVNHMKSASAIGSQEESLAFAERIHELLTRHNIDLAEVEAAGREPEPEPIDFILFSPAENQLSEPGQKVPLVTLLAQIVAQAHNCEVMILDPTGALQDFVVVGHASNRFVTVAVLQTLIPAVERQCKDAFFGLPQWQRGNAITFRRSFYHGYLGALRARYATSRARLEAGHETALVAISRALVDVHAHMRDKLGAQGGEEQVSLERTDAEAGVMGWDAAQNADLSGRNLTDVPKPGPKLVH